MVSGHTLPWPSPCESLSKVLSESPCARLPCTPRYREQDEHIRLHLPLVEEARLGWWHEVTRRLRENGESADAHAADGTTLLHLAAIAGRRKLIEELLAMGATPRARDGRGRTPFLCAAEHGSVPVAETLAAHDEDFDINDQDETGASALATAARLGHVRLVRWLCSQRETQPNGMEYALHSCSPSDCTLDWPLIALLIAL